MSLKEFGLRVACLVAFDITFSLSIGYHTPLWLIALACVVLSAQRDRWWNT